MEKALSVITKHGYTNGAIDLGRCFIDGMFVRSKNGKERVGNTKCGKGHKLMVIVEKTGIPIAVHVDSARPHEVKLVEPVLKKCMIKALPNSIFGDKAYDSDSLDKWLRSLGIKMNAPHRRNRIHKTQDGRALKSYKERWRVENFNCCIQRFRKVCIRYEKHLSNFIAFVHVATMMVCAQMLGIV